MCICISLYFLGHKIHRKNYKTTIFLKNNFRFDRTNTISSQKVKLIFKKCHTQNRNKNKQKKNKKEYTVAHTDFYGTKDKDKDKEKRLEYDLTNTKMLNHPSITVSQHQPQSNNKNNTNKTNNQLINKNSANNKNNNDNKEKNENNENNENDSSDDDIILPNQHNLMKPPPLGMYVPVFCFVLFFF